MFTLSQCQRRISRVFQPGNQHVPSEIRLEPRALTAPAIYRLPTTSPPALPDSVAANVTNGPSDVEVQSATEGDVSSDTDFLGYTLTVVGQVVNNIVDFANPDPPAGAVGTPGISINAYISQQADPDNPGYNGAPPYIGYSATGQRTYQLADNGISPVATTATVNEHLEIDYFPPPPDVAIAGFGVFFASSGFTLGGPTAPGTTLTETVTTDPTSNEVIIIVDATTPIGALPPINPATNTGGIPWTVAYDMGMGATYGPVNRDVYSLLTLNYSLTVTSP